MWSAYLLLGLVSAVAKGTQVNSSVPATIEETLLKRRCVPTAVTRGPCHVCYCTSKGAYQCLSDICVFEEKDNTKSNQPECEPDMLYNEGALWCLCDQRGFWRSSNCRSNFRSVRHKTTSLQGSVLKKDIPCESGSLYAVGCNVCECRATKLTADACTNRTCATGGKEEPCKMGQLIRVDQQLCACSRIGTYIDDRCIKLPTKETIQKISSGDIAELTAERPVTPHMICEPYSVIQQDCNTCSCSPYGRLTCTNKLCLSNANTGNSTMPFGSSLRASRLDLPELKSDKEPCEPGQKYRYKCNTCSCSSNRVLACTTMICLEFFGAHTEKKGELKIRKKKAYDVIHLPEIHEDEPCTQGVKYRLDCNVCVCNNGRLVCTKKLCLKKEDVTEQREFEKHKKVEMKHIKQVKADKQPLNKIYATKNKNMYMEVFDDKLVIHQRKHKEKHTRSDPNNKSVEPKVKEHENVETFNTNKVSTENAINKKVEEQKDNEKIKTNSEEKDNIREGGDSSRYPKLPSTKKCKPGQIYTKGCQRCFCTNKQVARCTNRPCAEMKGQVRLPKDVFPHITPREIASLPKLPHQAARCKLGAVYLVECNVCLCLINGNLFCQNKLCLAMDVVNRIAAQKQNGKSCQMKNGKMSPEVKVECIVCSCVQRKVSCQPVENCTAFRFRRQLHGELHPKISSESGIEKGDKCTPGMVYKQNCNNCYCQEDGSLRCTRKGCLNFDQVQRLKDQRTRLLKIDQ
ncbi:hypothetical protein O0L34_g10056 [Tuta absoluta]|nr:hypothetical protein O0L34_g10056 [Tuta absoluta]